MSLYIETNRQTINDCITVSTVVLSAVNTAGQLTCNSEEHEAWHKTELQKYLEFLIFIQIFLNITPGTLKLRQKY